MNTKYRVVASRPYMDAAVDSRVISRHRSMDAARRSAHRHSRHIRADVQLAITDGDRIISRCCTSDMFTGSTRYQEDVQ